MANAQPDQTVLMVALKLAATVHDVNAVERMLEAEVSPAAKAVIADVAMGRLEVATAIQYVPRLLSQPPVGVVLAAALELLYSREGDKKLGGSDGKLVEAMLGIPMNVQMRIILEFVATKQLTPSAAQPLLLQLIEKFSSKLEQKSKPKGPETATNAGSVVVKMPPRTIQYPSAEKSNTLSANPFPARIGDTTASHLVSHAPVRLDSETLAPGATMQIQSQDLSFGMRARALSNDDQMELELYGANPKNTQIDAEDGDSTSLPTAEIRKAPALDSNVLSFSSTRNPFWGTVEANTSPPPIAIMTAQHSASHSPDRLDLYQLGPAANMQGSPKFSPVRPRRRADHASRRVTKHEARAIREKAQAAASSPHRKDANWDFEDMMQEIIGHTNKPPPVEEQKRVQVPPEAGSFVNINLAPYNSDHPDKSGKVDPKFYGASHEHDLGLCYGTWCREDRQCLVGKDCPWRHYINKHAIGFIWRSGAKHEGYKFLQRAVRILQADRAIPVHTHIPIPNPKARYR